MGGVKLKLKLNSAQLKLELGLSLAKRSMIIVVPSCLKDADGAHTRSDQFVEFNGREEFIIG